MQSSTLLIRFFSVNFSDWTSSSDLQALILPFTTSNYNISKFDLVVFLLSLNYFARIFLKGM